MAERTSSPNIGNVERVVAMQGVPGAAELHPSELSVLASIARPRRLTPNEVLSRPGHPSSAFFVVQEGSVTVRHEESVQEAGPESVVGLLEALSHDPRGLDCQTTEGAVVLQVAIDDLEDVFDELPIILLRLAGHLARSALTLDPAPKSQARTDEPAPLPARALDLVERILLLRRCAALGGASIDAVAALANVAREVRVAAGEHLWRSGALPSSLYVIASGELENPAAKATLRAGDLAGELEMFAEARYAAQAVARLPLVALSIDRDALFDLLEDHSDLGVELLRAVSAELLAREGQPKREG